MISLHLLLFIELASLIPLSCQVLEYILQFPIHLHLFLLHFFRFQVIIEGLPLVELLHSLF